MIPRTLLVAAGILAASCVACAAAPPSSPPARGGGTGPVAATCLDGSSFLSHVQYLANGFDPSANNNYFNAPSGGSPITPGSQYATALQNAFQLAPSLFQQRLCKLTGIYINDGTGCSNSSSCIGGSWGYRIPPNPPGQPSCCTYIGISAALWKASAWSLSLNSTTSNWGCPSATVYAFHCFETDLLNSVFVANWYLYQLPQYSSANGLADNFDMVILAALAHEVGHVQWLQSVIPTTPGTSNYNTYVNNFFCPGTGSSFSSYSWRAVQTTEIWQTLSYQSLDTPQLGQHPKILSQIDAAIIQNDGMTAASLLNYLFQESSPWASYFAAQSPEEDFVETYKLYVLTNANAQSIPNEGPLNSLQWTMYNYTPTPYTQNIPQDYGHPVARNKGVPMTNNKSTLASKVQCIGNYI
jgi:hypothetical protein